MMIDVGSAFWYVGESRDHARDAVFATGVDGLILAVKTTDDCSRRVAGKAREEAMLLQAWQLCTEALADPFTGLRVGYREFAFRLREPDPLHSATGLLSSLLSDEVTGEAPWHLATCLCSGETLAQLSAGHSQPFPSPLAWASWRVNDHHDQDPLSWIVVG